MTLVDLGLLSGLSQATVGKLETPSGDSRMAIESVAAVSFAMNVHPSVMLGDRQAFVECLSGIVMESLCPPNVKGRATTGAEEKP